MSYLRTKSGFKLSTLALSIGLSILSSSGFALEALDDDGLADSTGEGLAFALNDFSFQLNSTNDTADAGYVRLIPVGAQSKLVNDHNNATANASGTDAEKSRAKYNIQIGKADIYLYGLAISKNDNDTNTRFSGNTVNIGSYVNPWLIKAETKDYENFAGESKPLSYFLVEAPEFNYVTDPYNLKVGFWADALVRDPNKIEGDPDQFALNGATRSGTTYVNNANTGQLTAQTVSNQTRENRLRLQAVLNGASLNGTSLKLFQTLDGATNSNGMSTNYNNTLGLAATVRLNMGDSTALKTVLTGDSTVNNTRYVSGWNDVHAGASTSLNATDGTDCNNSGTGSFSTDVGCRYIVQNRIAVDSKTRTKTFTLPTNLNNHVLRLSTRETTNTDLLNTPALNGGGAPVFASNEGLHLYSPNINLVLGTPWQPLTVGVAPDNRNFVIELARIPNVEAVYKQIYTDYTGTDSSYKGGTCSLYWCGDSSKNATHSSISIGTTEAYGTAGAGLLTAYKGEDAIGVSFGALQSSSSMTSYSSQMTEVQYAQRQQNEQNWRQRSQCTGSVFGNCTSRTDTPGSLYQWQYYSGSSYVNSTAPSSWQSPPANATQCSTAAFNGNSTCNNSSGTTPMYGNVANRTWSATNLNGAAWQQNAKPEVDSFIGSANGTTGYTFPSASPNLAPTPAYASNTPLNNLGSAVIDGVLIQHLKFTTKGL